MKKISKQVLKILNQKTGPLRNDSFYANAHLFNDYYWYRSYNDKHFILIESVETNLKRNIHEVTTLRKVR